MNDRATKRAFVRLAMAALKDGGTPKLVLYEALLLAAEALQEAPGEEAAEGGKRFARFDEDGLVLSLTKLEETDLLGGNFGPTLRHLLKLASTPQIAQTTVRAELRKKPMPVGVASAIVLIAAAAAQKNKDASP